MRILVNIYLILSPYIPKFVIPFSPRCQIHDEGLPFCQSTSTKKSGTETIKTYATVTINLILKVKVTEKSVRTETEMRLSKLF